MKATAKNAKGAKCGKATPRLNARTVAEVIANRLFTNGSKQVAQRLVLDRESILPHTSRTLVSNGPQCAGCGCTEGNACTDPDLGQGCAWVQLEPFPWCSVCALLLGSGPMPDGPMAIEPAGDALVEFDAGGVDLEELLAGGAGPAFWS